MRHSESINDLAAALAKAQSIIENATKDGKNPHFNSKYATLAAVLDACREPLSKNNLSIVQTAEKKEYGWVLVTTLMHSSGQWICGENPIIASKQDAQGFGSGLTYSRRYGLASMVGIFQEDDDANAAVLTDKTSQIQQKQPPKNFAPQTQAEASQWKRP